MMGKVGHKHTEESKEKMRKSHKGKKLSEEHKRNISKSQKGKTLSRERVEKLRRVNKGKVVSEETRRKMSESGKKKKLSEEHKRKISQRLRERVIKDETREKLRKNALERGLGTKIQPTLESKREAAKKRVGKKRVITEKWKSSARRVGDQLKGQKRSPESIEKHRQAMKGRIFSEQHRERLSISGKGKHSGLNAPHYIDGRTKDNCSYPPEFTDYLKKKVRKRDKYTCQACLETTKGKSGHVHHIDGDKNNCTMENLTLVCISCHNKIHSYSENHGEAIVRFRQLLKPENRPLKAI